MLSDASDLWKRCGLDANLILHLTFQEQKVKILYFKIDTSLTDANFKFWKSVKRLIFKKNLNINANIKLNIVLWNLP